MVGSRHVVVFTIAGQRYGLRLGAVERVLPAVEVVPLPRAPEVVLGVINLQGRIIPLVDIRSRFGLPAREIDLADHIIVARSARRTVALLAERVEGPGAYSEEETIPAAAVLPGTPYLEGVVALPDGMVLIHDLDAFLSLEEEAALTSALGAPSDARP